jgi:two-component system alkaline phosphatase synthesis response regulator PhoP
MKDGKNVILCVDDDQDFLDSMRTIVESAGYIMETAASADQGIKKYKEAKPDIILVDLMMEEIDSGVGFVRDVRALGGKLPIFMLSSVGDNLNRSADYSQLGLSGVLQKPINPKLLISTLGAKLKK